MHVIDHSKRTVNGMVVSKCLFDKACRQNSRLIDARINLRRGYIRPWNKIRLQERQEVISKARPQLLFYSRACPIDFSTIEGRRIEVKYTEHKTLDDALKFYRDNSEPPYSCVVCMDLGRVHNAVGLLAPCPEPCEARRAYYGF